MIPQRFFLMKLAILNTFKRKLRASLAVGGIALSSGIMIILFGVGIGLQSLVTEQVEKTGSKDVITVNQRNIQAIKLDESRVSSIKSISGVGQVEELVGLVGTLTYNGIDLSIPVYAVTQDYFQLSPQKAQIGTTINQPRDSQLIVSSTTLESFDLSPRDAENKPISVAIDVPREYGKSNKSSSSSDSGQFTIAAVVEREQQPVAYISLETARKQGVTSVSQLKVRLSDPDKMSAVRESIEQMGLQTTNIQDSIDEVQRVFSVIQRILLIFGIIALVITVFGTFNVITLTLIEETQQIGFLRLMGMQKHEVAFLFIAQSVMLTVSGITLGILLGYLGGFVINGITQALAGDTVFSDSVYLFKIPYIETIIMFMLSAGLGWLIGKLSARRAVVIGPLEELNK